MALRYLFWQSSLEMGRAIKFGFYISRILCSVKKESIDYCLNPSRQKKDIVEQSIFVSSLFNSYCRTLYALCFSTLGPPKYDLAMNKTEAPMQKTANPFSTKFIDILSYLILSYSIIYISILLQPSRFIFVSSRPHSYSTIRMSFLHDGETL